MADDPTIFQEGAQALKTIKQLKEAGKTISEIRKELSELSSEGLENAQRIAEASNKQEILDVLEKELKARDKILKSLEKQVEQQEKAAKVASTRAEQNEAKRKLNDILIKQAEEKLQYENKNTEAAEKYRKEIENLNDENVKLTENTKKYNEALQAMNKRFDSFSSLLKDLASGDYFGVVKKGLGGLASSFEEFAKESYSKLYARVKADDFDISGMMENFSLDSMKEKLSTARDFVSNLGTKVKNVFQGNGGLKQSFISGAKSIGQMTAQFGMATAAMGTFLAVSALVIGALIAIAAAIGAAMILMKFNLELENTARKLAMTTGLSKDFSNAMFKNAESLRAIGASAEDIAGVVTALNSTFTDFSMISTASARKATETAVVLGKLGMSADDVGRGFQTLTKGLAQTPEQAADTMVAMDALARDLGVSTSKIGADFSAAASSLQKLSGPAAIQAFKQLSVVSKATGIEVSRLLSITEKFDTFEGAATQAGKLNAALGGNFVNAMELMTATNPVERFEMIRDSILDSGLAFDDMSYYQKKFFAEAAGMQDVGELALAMGGDFGAVNSELGKTQAEYEAAAKRAESFQSVQEQLKNSFYQLIPVITPLIEKMGEFTNQFTDFVEQNKDEVQDVFRAIGDVMMTMVDTFMTLTPIITPILQIFIKLVEYGIRFGTVFGLVGEVNKSLKKSMTERRSPSLIGATRMMADSYEKINAEGRMTAANISGIGDATARTATKVRTAAPIIANNTMYRSSTSSTTINNGQGSDTAISIKFDNKKMSELFEVQVEKSVAKAARRSVIGGR